jgi:hypothetical protein
MTVSGSPSPAFGILLVDCAVIYVGDGVMSKEKIALNEAVTVLNACTGVGWLVVLALSHLAYLSVRLFSTAFGVSTENSLLKTTWYVPPSRGKFTFMLSCVTL